MNEITLKATKQSTQTSPTISFNNRGDYLDFLKEIPDGHELIIKISHKRSLNQNALFHSWVSIISEHIGESNEAVKAWLVCKFAGCNETEIEGKVYTIPISTAKLSKKEFADLMTQIDIFAVQELKIVLPTQNQDNLTK